MEKMQENLRQFLNKCKKNLRLPKQLRISLEIIRGVAFLHQQTPPLVHRDLNDKNVMFSFEGVVKIGDFGQSKLKKDLYLTSGQPGMVTFMPPEALDVDASKYNESLDIFSVGVLMLEIGTQQEPLVNLRGIGVIREVDRRERDLKALGEEHPLRPQILLCLKDNPKERPKASDLQREVLALVDEGDEVSIYTYIISLALAKCFLYTCIWPASNVWIGCGTWQICLCYDEPCGFLTFLYITMPMHVTVRELRVTQRNEFIFVGFIKHFTTISRKCHVCSGCSARLQLVP